MRKLIFSLAAAGAVVAVATPAAAQYPQQRYSQSYGHNNVVRVRALQVRVDRIQRDLGRLVQRRMISSNEYRNRQQDARDIERRLRRDARDGRGLNRNEIISIENRIVRLEQKIARDIRDGRVRGIRW